MPISTSLLRAATLFCALGLTACGGGGGAGVADATATPGSSTTARIEGTAATGAPLAQASVTVQCLGGSTTTTTNAQGTYAVNISANAALPCAVQVRAGNVVLHSAALQPGVVNVSPLTELQFAVMAGSADRVGAFAAFAADPAAATRYTAGTAAAAWASARTRLLTLGLNASAAATLNALADPRTQAFAATAGDAHDGLLDQFAQRLAANSLTLDTFIAQLLNRAPLGSFASASTGLTATFNASASTDPEGHALSYRWTFGDGTPEQTTAAPTTTHVFPATGTYVVNLVVLDALGAASSVVSQNITVVPLPPVNRPPVASFAAAVNNLSVGVDAGLSSDPDGSIASYAWTFGEAGSASNTGSGKVSSHSYSAPGSYTVTLTVTDNAGATATSQQVVTVNVPPNVSPIAGFAATPNALLVAFDGSASIDTDGAIVSYQWSFGDMASGSANTVAGRTASHAFSASGTYVVSLTVQDNAGAVGVVSQNVTVAPPTVVTTGRLNDTGITSSQCYQSGSDVLVSCTSTAAIALNAKQDGMVGRDADPATNSAVDGTGGFSFTKIGASGESLPASATTWFCVKDNVTGLMWEVKTADGGLRDRNKTYTHYDSITSPQKGTGSNPTQAEIDAATNATGFMKEVNAVGLCGARNWRLPTAAELHSLVDYSVPSPGPAINATWFPNTPASSAYWSATPLVGSPGRAWYVAFSGGLVSNGSRDETSQVRLVR